MKTGIELITQERQEQLEKHCRSVADDVYWNPNNQLSKAAAVLIQEEIFKGDYTIPEGWNVKIWLKMCDKPYKERLIIAGALLAAEIDRIIQVEGNTVNE